MLIVGAGGLATQVFDDLERMAMQDIVFWSEVETKYTFIEKKYRIIKNDESVKEYFRNISRSFILGVGGPETRKMMSARFKELGGESASFLSPGAIISPYIASVGEGTVILSRVEIEPGVQIGKHCLFNKTANVGHGCIIADYCEVCPGVILTGEVELGEGAYIGTRAIILPKVKIGRNAVIAAGAIVRKNVPDNAVVSGDMATVKFFKKE